jgi:hypothetical protein
LRRALDRAHVLHAVGRDADALVLLEDLAGAEPGMRAEIDNLRGTVAHALDLDADAEAFFEAAFFEAARTGDDALAARAAAGLARLAAVRAPRSPEVARWLRHAEAALERAQIDDPDVAAAVAELQR